MIFDGLNINNIEKDKKQKSLESLRGGFLIHTTDPVTNEPIRCTDKNATIEILTHARKMNDISTDEKLQELLTVTLEKSEQRNRELRELTITDPLTHLRNLRRRDEVLARSIEELTYFNEKEHANKLGLIVFQVDLKGLKQINLQGQAAGDKALIDFAKLLKDTVRNDDLAFRIGGDEFSVILSIEKKEGSDFNEDEVFGEISERITNKLKDIAYIGYAILKKEGKDLKIQESKETDGFTGLPISEQLIKTADKRMTENKAMEKAKNIGA